MTAPPITIDYDLSECRMRFKVDADDFEGLTDDQIATELQDRIDADARANCTFHATNMASAVRDIRAALVELAKEQKEGELP